MIGADVQEIVPHYRHCPGLLRLCRSSDWKTTSADHRDYCRESDTSEELTVRLVTDKEKRDGVVRVVLVKDPLEDGTERAYIVEHVKKR